MDRIAEDSADDDAFPLAPAQRDRLIVAAEDDGFRVVLNRDGYLVMHRQADQQERVATNSSRPFTRILR